jgi:hypothetical protein
MSPRGVTARIPAGYLPEEREVCPRCRKGTVSRLCRLLVCTELACEWSAPRFVKRGTEPAPVERPKLPRVPPPRHLGSNDERHQRAVECRRAVLEHVGTHPWSTTAEIAGALKLAQRAVLHALVAAGARRRRREGPIFEYAAREEAIAC